MLGKALVKRAVLSPRATTHPPHSHPHPQVALSGAHALGRCHADRSGFVGPWTRAPTTFSNDYFRLLVEEKWSPKTAPNGATQFVNAASGGDLMMLKSDMTLVEDAKFKPFVVACECVWGGRGGRGAPFADQDAHPEPSFPPPQTPRTGTRSPPTLPPRL